MKAITALLTLALLLLTALSGCQTVLQQFQKSVNGRTEPAQVYQEKAEALEKAEEIQTAIFYQEVVAALDKDDPKVHQKLQQLKQAAQKTAEVHFQRGLEYYRNSDLKRALREFLITLRYNPAHPQARDYLKKRLHSAEQRIYQVKSGDSFTKIANKVYNDSGKAYVLAWFNDLDPQKPLQIGTELTLPDLGTEYLSPPSPPRTDESKVLMDKARKAYDHKRYTRVYALTNAIEKASPGHPEARKLADAAHFDQGMALMNQKQYLAAIEQFKQISSRHKGRDQAIAQARKRISQQAIGEKLKVARQLLEEKAWRSVINITEEILAEDSKNDQARMLFSNASYKYGKILLDTGQTGRAIEILSRISPTYEDTGQLLSLARARMRSQAETLYRDGVKHFINEDLEKAIAAWQKTLEFNPDHPKARQDIENAQRLLEKLRKLDQEPE